MHIFVSICNLWYKDWESKMHLCINLCINMHRCMHIDTKIDEHWYQDWCIHWCANSRLMHHACIHTFTYTSCMHPSCIYTCIDTYIYIDAYTLLKGSELTIWCCCRSSHTSPHWAQRQPESLQGGGRRCYPCRHCFCRRCSAVLQSLWSHHGWDCRFVRSSLSLSLSVPNLLLFKLLITFGLMDLGLN